MTNPFKTVLVLILLITNSLIAQENSTPIVVRVNYTCLNFDVINNDNLRQFDFEDVLNEKGIKLLSPLLTVYPEVNKLKIRKIFPNLTTNDTVSISRLGHRVTIPPFWATFQMIVPEDIDTYKFMITLDKQTQLIDYVHTEPKAELASVPNDTLYHKQHSLNGSIPNAHINIEEAWAIETGVPYIKIAVHDNGIDSLHPDLNVIFGAGYNNSDYPENDWGTPGLHGTPVAGIIGARRNNETGIAGIAGGNGTDTTGCSLIDLNVKFNTNNSSYFMAAVVDAARSVGTYWNYPYPVNSGYSNFFNQTPGFGVHISNHSYVMRASLPAIIEGKDLLPDDEIFQGPCELCREAFLFSLQNGVINVVARGNSGSVSEQGNSPNPLTISDVFPASLPDNWVISVGASGFDGLTVQEGLNQSNYEASINYFSLYGGNMDIIAPGSDSIVYTTNTYENYMTNPYISFRGTSAAAPHVSGVVALLLSHYNKNCYSNKNLSVEDVEYILEKSATDINTPGYDDLSGAGRLNAGAAIKMIENATLQIVHPELLLNSQIIARDTISIEYHKALTADNWGPISTPFPLERLRYYQVERLLVENTYSFDEYISSSGTTKILDYWARPSASNGVKFYNDTSILYLAPGGSVDTSMVFDKFDLEPYDTIVNIDSTLNTIKTRGYFYHFIAKYDPIIASQGPDELIINPFDPVDYWYPINPTSDTAKLLVSLYIKDTTLISYFDSPCLADNPLYDEDYAHLGLNETEPDLIQIFPNPFYSNLTIQFNQEGNKKEILVYDMQGKIIDQQHTNNNSYTLNTKHYLSGFYFLTCKLDDKVYNFKIIKQ